MLITWHYTTYEKIRLWLMLDEYNRQEFLFLLFLSSLIGFRTVAGNTDPYSTYL